MAKQVKVSFKHSIAFCEIASDQQPYLDRGFVEELKEAVEQINQEKNAKVVILLGGKKNFCLGGSHSALSTEEHLEALPFYVADIPRLLLKIEVPTIACMGGHALGGGLLLGLWCDFAALNEASLYGANFMAIGFTPGMGGTIVMEEAFGSFNARRLLFTGKLIKGREIKQMGCPLSGSVHESDNVQSYCFEWAEEISRLPLISLKMLKVNQSYKRKILLEEALEKEQKMHKNLFSQAEIREFIQEQHYQQS